MSHLRQQAFSVHGLKYVADAEWDDVAEVLVASETRGIGIARSQFAWVCTENGALGLMAYPQSDLYIKMKDKLGL